MLQLNLKITSLVFFLGVVLDPQFKKGWVKRSGHSESEIIAAVKQQLEARYRNYRKRCTIIHWRFCIRL